MFPRLVVMLWFRPALSATCTRVIAVRFARLSVRVVTGGAAVLTVAIGRRATGVITTATAAAAAATPAATTATLTAFAFFAGALLIALGRGSSLGSRSFLTRLRLCLLRLLLLTSVLL